MIPLQAKDLNGAALEARDFLVNPHEAKLYANTDRADGAWTSLIFVFKGHIAAVFACEGHWFLCGYSSGLREIKAKYRDAVMLESDGCIVSLDARRVLAACVERKP